MPDELFPLPLTVFEKYMLADDRPRYPMTFSVRMLLRGELDRHAWEAALAEVLPQHPLLQAVVDVSHRRAPCWRASTGRAVWIDWGLWDAPLECPREERIDLAVEPGLRIWVRTGADRAQLTFQFHHSCCDGLGAFRFLGHLLGAYGRRTAPESMQPRVEPIETWRVRRRGQLAVKSPEPISRWQAARATIAEAARWLRRRPRPLEAPAAGAGLDRTPLPFPGMLVHSFTSDQTGRLRSAAAAAGTMLNDLLLRDLFLTVASWNGESSPRRRGWLTINMPTSLRDRGDARMPAVNMMSYTFLTRPLVECQDPDRLLDGIRWETELIKRWNLGHFFHAGVRFAQRIPWLLSTALSLNHCFATVVATNLGDMRRRLQVRAPLESGELVFGNLRLEEIVGVPPLRPKTHAGFAFFRYAGKLSIAVRCDPHRFAATDARRLLMRYVECLTTSMGPSEDPAVRDATLAVNEG